jgi:hypothetical protein
MEKLTDAKLDNLISYYERALNNLVYIANRSRSKSYVGLTYTIISTLSALNELNKLRKNSKTGGT